MFFCVQRACPKSDQEENELVMVSLRNLYEEKQKHHQHTVPGEAKQVHLSPQDVLNKCTKQMLKRYSLYF